MVQAAAAAPDWVDESKIVLNISPHGHPDLVQIDMRCHIESK